MASRLPSAAFTAPLPLTPRCIPPARCPTRRPQSRPSPRAELDSVPNSPNLLLRSWADSRTVSSTVDLSRRFISVLFLSNYCQRAAYAEKRLTQLAEHYSVSRRLLILSAGVYSNPGDLLPMKLVTAAKRQGIDMSDERPCAAFEVSDLLDVIAVEYYDFVVVVDRHVKEHIMELAEGFAHTSGGHLYEWERKVRLLCNFDGTMPERTSNSASSPLDVPSFNAVPDYEMSMDIINAGCESVVRSLLTAGL